MKTTTPHSDLTGFVQHLARQARPTSLCDYDDYFQAGLLGLVRAERRYRGEPEGWERYAKKCVRNSIREAVLEGLAGLSGPRDAKRRAWRRCGSGEMESSDLLLVREGRPLREIQDARRPVTWPDDLPDRVLNLVELRMQNYTLAEIARRVGRSVKWVWSQLEALKQEAGRA